MNFGSEKCFCLGACCEKPRCDEEPLDDMRAEEKCGRCPQERLDLAVREGSELRLLLGVVLRVAPGFAKASWLDAKDLEPARGLEPVNERARVFAEFPT